MNHPATTWECPYCSTAIHQHGPTPPPGWALIIVEDESWTSCPTCIEQVLHELANAHGIPISTNEEHILAPQ